MISGEFNEFKWQADIDEGDLELDEGFAVTVETPTGGLITFEVYGPFEYEDYEDVIEELIEDDTEHYTSTS
jgi:hypothetical protein